MPARRWRLLMRVISVTIHTDAVTISRINKRPAYIAFTQKHRWGGRSGSVCCKKQVAGLPLKAEGIAWRAVVQRWLRWLTSAKWAEWNARRGNVDRWAGCFDAALRFYFAEGKNNTGRIVWNGGPWRINNRWRLWFVFAANGPLPAIVCLKPPWWMAKALYTPPPEIWIVMGVAWRAPAILAWLPNWNSDCTRRLKPCRCITLKAKSLTQSKQNYCRRGLQRFGLCH